LSTHPASSPEHRFITAITGTSFATGKRRRADGVRHRHLPGRQRYTPNNYGVLNSAAVNVKRPGGQGYRLHRRRHRGNLAADYPQYFSFNNSCGGCLFGKPVGGFRDEFWLNISTTSPASNPTPETGDGAAVHHRRARRGWTRPGRRGDAIEFDNGRLPEQDRPGPSARPPRSSLMPRSRTWRTARVAGGPENDLGQGNDPSSPTSIRDQRAVLAGECNYPPPGLQAWLGTYARPCSTSNTSWLHRSSAHRPIRLATTSTRYSKTSTCTTSRTPRAAKKGQPGLEHGQGRQELECRGPARRTRTQPGPPRNAAAHGITLSADELSR
jgi:hypothetical protein